MSKNPTDLYNVLSFISLFSAMLPASFYLEACGKTQIKIVVTNSDMEITLHFISHFISYSPTVDALWAIKKSFKEIISECLPSTRYKWLRRRLADVGIDRQLPCSLQKELCSFPSNCISFLFTLKQYGVPTALQSAWKLNIAITNLGEKLILRREIKNGYIYIDIPISLCISIHKSVTGAHQLEANPASWVTDRLWQGVTRLMALPGGSSITLSLPRECFWDLTTANITQVLQQ